MSGGSFGFTIGKREQTDRLAQEGATQSASRSLVGSTDGNLTLTAGTEAKVSGSDLVAAKDLAITAPSITIDPGLDLTRTQERHDVKQSGLTVAVSSPVLAAAQTLRAMNTAARESQDPRVRALAAATAGLATKNAYDAVASNPGAAGGVTVSATIGQSRSHSESQTDTTTAAGSLLKAGGDVTLTATERDLTVVGSTIQAGNDANLKAAGNLNLLSSQDTNRTQGHSSGSSWGVGVAATYGPKGWAAGITANASASKGRSQGDDVSHTNTKVIAGNTASLESGRDTSLKGAVVSGSQVTAHAGGNLLIESPQDTSTYRSQDSSAGGSVTFGFGFAASANASRQRINGDHASVTSQSGIQAGDGGFQVTVQGHTDLKGAVIASTEKAVAEGRNTLTTGSLTQSDLENRSEYEATSVGVGVSASRAGSGSSKNWQSFQDKTGASLPTAMSAEGQDQSTTRSGLSGATVTITDEAKRAASEQALANLDRAATTGQDRANALANTFDQDEIRRAFEVTQAFGQEVGTFLANKAAKADEARKAFEAAYQEEMAKPVDQRDAARVQTLGAELERAATWAPGGTSRQLLTALSAAANGNVTGTSAQLIQNTFVSFVQQKGAQYLGELVGTGKLKEGSPEHAALHAIVAATGSAASGQDMLSGSAGAAASSLLTNLFDNQSLGQTPEEQEAHRNLLLTLVAGLSESLGGDTPSATTSGLFALDNNASLSLLNWPTRFVASEQSGRTVIRKLTGNLSLDIQNRACDWINEKIDAGFFDQGAKLKNGTFIVKDGYYLTDTTLGNVASWENFALFLADSRTPVSMMDDRYMNYMFQVYREQNNLTWREIGEPLMAYATGAAELAKGAFAPSNVKPPLPEYHTANKYNPYPKLVTEPPAEPAKVETKGQLQTQPQTTNGVNATDATSAVEPVARIAPGSLPAAEEASLSQTIKHIDAGTKPTGSLAKKWGTKFKNWNGDLPGTKGEASPYVEYRVAPTTGNSGAGPLRVVVNQETGAMYYTWTHYGDMGMPAFVRIR